MKTPTTVCLLLFLCSLFCANALDSITLKAGGGGLAVQINSTGSYDVTVDGEPWLFNGFEAFHYNKQWYSNGMGAQPALTVVSMDTSSAWDSLLGECNVVTITWLVDGYPIITEFKAYNSTEVLVFTQSFPKGLPSTAVGNSNDVISAFPGFQDVAENFYFTFSGTFANPVLGKYDPAKKPSFDIQTGNPILFYNQPLRTLMISPLDTFMVSSNVFSPSLGSHFAVGLQGMVESIPAGFQHSTIFYAGQGINDTFMAWGDILLNFYGKERTAVDADVVLKYLGYWTDNGGYYWYNPETGKTYEQTIEDVRKYHESIGLPFGYYQFDSWWYFKENSSEYLSALYLWEPRPDVFPNGFLNVSNSIDNLPIALHNRHFGATNKYIGNFTFIVESSLALPVDENLFLHIMGKAQTWGLQVYEQDWMVTTYTTMEATQNDVSNSRTWLKAMGDAAAQLGITIQYCMDLPIMVLQSVEIPAVTQIRASIDYQLQANQWQVAYTGLFIWAMGAIPFKDDFWTTSYQEGCVFRSQDNCTEPNPELQALVSSLSAGPIGPSDKIGLTNKTLLMKTCTADGLLLKPTKPATPLDQVFLDYFVDGQMLQIWDTYTQIGQYRWHYVFAAGLEKEFNLQTSFIALSGVKSVIFDYVALSTTYHANATQQIDYFDDQTPYNIPAKGTTSDGVIGYTYLVIAPVIPDAQWVLLGEVDKFIPVSVQRITQLTISGAQMTGIVTGSSGESVNLVFSKASDIGQITIVTCTISQSGYATLTCGSTCSCV